MSGSPARVSCSHGIHDQSSSTISRDGFVLSGGTVRESGPSPLLKSLRSNQARNGVMALRSANGGGRDTCPVIQRCRGGLEDPIEVFEINVSTLVNV
jgi:hypothetical protein